MVDTLVAGKDRNAVRAEFENLKTKKKWQIGNGFDLDLGWGSGLRN